MLCDVLAVLKLKEQFEMYPIFYLTTHFIFTTLENNKKTSLLISKLGSKDRM